MTMIIDATALLKVDDPNTGYNVEPLAPVEIRDSNGNLAIIYSDEAMTNPISQPTNCDANGQFLCYAEDGFYNVTISFTSGSVTRSVSQEVHDDIYTRNFKSLSDLRSKIDASGKVLDFTKLAQGTRLYWQGYHSQSDGGSNWGLVKKGDSTLVNDDGGSIFIIVNDSVNGVWVEANMSGTLSPEKFGAIENQDATSEFNNLYAAANRIKISKPYLVSGVINVNSNTSTTFVGAGMITMTANNTTMFYAFNKENVTFRNPVLMGKGVTDTASTYNQDNGTVNAAAHGIWFDECLNVRVYGGDVRYFKNDGIRASYSSRVYIERNLVVGTYPDDDIPKFNTGRQQFGIIVHAESCAEKGANMKQVMVDKTHSRHLNYDINIVNNIVEDTAIAYIVYPGYTNVTIAGNKTRRDLSQHSLYVFPDYMTYVTNNQFNASQSVGIKISHVVTASYNIPTLTKIRGNTVSNNSGPSISVEMFDPNGDGSSDETKSSTYYDSLTISQHTSKGSVDSGIRATCIKGGVITDCEFSDISPASSREALTLMNFGGTVSSVKISDCGYAALGGSLRVFDTFRLVNNTFEGCQKSSTGFYAAMAKGVRPRKFDATRYVNWYATDSYLINDATNEVYYVSVGGVAEGTAPTGTGTITSGECTFAYAGLYDDLRYKVVIDNNRFEVGGGTQGQGSISLNDFSFDLYVRDNFADASLKNAELLGNYYEYIGNNLDNAAKSSGTFIGMSSGVAGNDYISTSLPITGTYEKMDKIWHPDPVALGYMGWVCVNRNPAGSGSTWQKFGALVP